MKNLEIFKEKKTPLNQIYGGDGDHVPTEKCIEGKKVCDYWVDENCNGKRDEGEWCTTIKKCNTKKQQ